MKVRLLKKLRKKVTIGYYTSKKEVRSTETHDVLLGRFVVMGSNKGKYFCETKQDAINRRRFVILELLEEIRVNNNLKIRKLDI